jgi:predicted lipoprotein with Yx(FWY)xxD motif
MIGSFRRWTMVLGVFAVAAVGLAACGGDDDADDSASATSGGTASAGGVTTETIDGTDVLVGSDGQALYSADQEKGGKILCTESCASIWKPVPASDGSGAPSDLMLGEVDRPDGEKQLTYKGAPLYTFTEEGPGELTGNGFEDDFAGTHFTWRAATTGGSGSSTTDSGGSDSSGVPGY